jgi:hypothetical protein
LARDEELRNNVERYETGANKTGFFKVEFNKKKFYYVCNAGDSILRPRLTKSWFDKVMENQLTHEAVSRRIFVS